MASIGQIELQLKEIDQLFNSMDPSPFHEKDLDDDAEMFLVSWAREFPPRTPLSILIHIPLKDDYDPATTAYVTEKAVQHYFTRKTELARRDFRRLLEEGRLSLVIGIAFLAICMLLGQLLGGMFSGTFGDLLRESLLIGGWVAMWRPMEIGLYEWWPLWRTVQLYARLSDAAVSFDWQSGQVP